MELIFLIIPRQWESEKLIDDYHQNKGLPGDWKNQV